MKIEVIALDKPAEKFETKIKKISGRAAKFFPEKGSVEVYIIGGKRMLALNKKFRGKNKSTNVLSFQKPKDFPGTKLGEVYLDPIYIEKHKEDPALMLVHGVLHILGYDHEKKNDRIKMERKEKQLLSKIV